MRDGDANGSLGLPVHIVACLYDLDGVLTETAKLHEAAWKQVFDQVIDSWNAAGHGTQAPFSRQDYLDDVDGRPRVEGVRTFLEARGIDLPDGDADSPADLGTVCGIATAKNDVVGRMIHDVGVEAYPGSLRYLTAVAAAGLRRAVVSSSENAGPVLDSCGLSHLIEVRIDGVDVRDHHLAGKPDPATFRAAAERLGLDVAVCAVFEDAVAGVEAGRDGHFGAVIGVNRADHHHADELRAAGATIVVDDLGELLE